jgi:TetR/AcrR family transcriptional repressor of nem operon
MAQKSTSRSVGRPREFDEEAALKAAMDAFWAKGYEATSMSDLCNCTGLHKGSLYQAFGDKHKLFMDALRHYSENQFKSVAAVAFKSDSPLENIRAAVNKFCTDAGGDNGCMVINTMVELAPHDPQVKAELRSFAERRMRVMSELIGKAQELGEISVQKEPQRLARQLMMTLAGGATMVKGFITPAEVTEAMNDLIDSWV